MTEPVGDIHSFLEIVSIAEVERDRSAIASQCFSEGEMAELASRRTQTMAGFLALKKALAGLFSSAAGGAGFSERDFILSHDENGAPRLVSCPELPGGRGALKVHLSISHTREWAYGLAAYQEDGDG